MKLNGIQDTEVDGDFEGKRRFPKGRKMLCLCNTAKKDLSYELLRTIHPLRKNLPGINKTNRKHNIRPI